MLLGRLYPQSASREARVEADNISRATEKAKQSAAWDSLSTEEQAGVDRAFAELQVVYHGDDHNLIHVSLEKLNQATMKLAENMMNSAVQGALRGLRSSFSAFEQRRSGRSGQRWKKLVP
jgi:hypothetical protein